MGGKTGSMILYSEVYDRGQVFVSADTTTESGVKKRSYSLMCFIFLIILLYRNSTFAN